MKQPWAILLGLGLLAALAGCVAIPQWQQQQRQAGALTHLQQAGVQLHLGQLTDQRVPVAYTTPDREDLVAEYTLADITEGQPLAAFTAGVAGAWPGLAKPLHQVRVQLSVQTLRAQVLGPTMAFPQGRYQITVSGIVVTDNLSTGQPLWQDRFQVETTQARSAPQQRQPSVAQDRQALRQLLSAAGADVGALVTQAVAQRYGWQPQVVTPSQGQP